MDDRLVCSIDPSLVEPCRDKLVAIDMVTDYERLVDSLMAIVTKDGAVWSYVSSYAPRLVNPSYLPTSSVYLVEAV